METKNDKHIWYLSTNSEDEYKNYLSAVEGVKDFYDARGYDYQFEHGPIADTEPTRYFIRLEVYDFSED